MLSNTIKGKYFHISKPYEPLGKDNRVDGFESVGEWKLRTGKTPSVIELGVSAYDPANYGR
jgi:hypothetical protein